MTNLEEYQILRAIEKIVDRYVVCFHDEFAADRYAFKTRQGEWCTLPRKEVESVAAHI